MIYLDHAASTPMLPEVKKAMMKVFDEHYANPHASHELGVAAMREVEEAQRVIADKINAEPSEIIFTSGATEANNLAIKGLAEANRHKGRHIVTSAIEHKCILNICAYLETKGFEVTYVMPTSQGIVEVDAVRAALRDDTILVSIMHVNNEIGTIQPIAEIGTMCFERGVLFHTDAAQSFCKLDIDVLEMEIDAMSVSAHKFGGPKGIGFLYLRDARNSNIVPVLHGGGQQMGVRGGTLSPPLIVGMNVAVQNFIFDPQSLVDLVDLVDLEWPSYTCITSALRLEGIYPIFADSTSHAIALANKVAVSMGSACNSKSIEPSHVLSAMGVSEDLSRRFIRLSNFSKN